ncbi:MAG TPA: FtsX-like permease family protein [Steroidobacteraceae bacterium]|nr:FtsX-like permease family protein [Steroidobacteraceae bacterium]
MNRSQQLIAVSALGLRSIPQRWGASLVAVIGIAGVVLVLVSVLAIGEGLRTMLTTGDASIAVVLKREAVHEMSAYLNEEEVIAITHNPEFAADAQGALVSAEGLTSVELPLRSAHADAYAVVRGVAAQGPKLRRHFEITKGRMFESGKHELIVGDEIVQQFSGVNIGDHLQIQDTDWVVVGEFAAGGSAAESELWCDQRTFADAFHFGAGAFTVRGRLRSGASLATLKASLAKDPRLAMRVMSERELRAHESKKMVEPLRTAARVVALLMGIAAAFGALNTMYAAVASRSREIGTLRALGFDKAPVVVSILSESMALGCIGGVVGVLLAYALVDGIHFSTSSREFVGQLGFTFLVTPSLIAQGLLYSLVLGLIGGVLPCLRAARLPVAQALARI